MELEGCCPESPDVLSRPGLGWGLLRVNTLSVRLRLLPNEFIVSLSRRCIGMSMVSLIVSLTRAGMRAAAAAAPLMNADAPDNIVTKSR